MPKSRNTEHSGRVPGWFGRWRGRDRRVIDLHEYRREHEDGPDRDPDPTPPTTPGQRAQLAAVA